MELLSFLKELGSASLGFFWLPLALWTIMSLIAVGIMRYSEQVHSMFQYHGRIALLCALPIGIIASGINHWISNYAEATRQFATKFIVIQAPITVSATSAETWSSLWLNLEFLGGVLIALLSAISLLLLLKLAIDFISLYRFAQSLSGQPLDNLTGISDRNQRISESLGVPVSISFSSDVKVPFTYGWRRPVIVSPIDLKRGHADKLNMAIRHELMHIKHRDYALNTVIMVVKALFWFHPLTHKLYNGFKEYREISCDTEVLTDTSISRKSYAELLFELASKDSIKNTPVVSMAVNSSNLKKRIQIMTSQTNKSHMFKNSLFIVLVTALFITGIMACSDIQDSGITNRDVEQAQSQMEKTNPNTQPLYVLDGTIIESQAEKNKLASVKTKYIKSINVLKGEKATQKYGEKGENGVIEFQLLDEEKAFNDLKSPPKPGSKVKNNEEDYFVVVEQMPELIGGMQALQECAEYPELAKKAGIEGRVIVQFVVTERGEVENPQVIRGVGSGIDEEALRCVRQAEFKPGMQRGKEVRVQYSLPIIFKLGKNNSE